MKKVVLLSVGVLILSMIAVGINAQMKDMRSEEMKVAAATIMKEKAKLIKEGNYVCCLKNPCNQCALMMGMCPCGKNAATGNPVCHECKGGWAAGDGAISGKSPGDIKVMER